MEQHGHCKDTEEFMTVLGKAVRILHETQNPSVGPELAKDLLTKIREIPFPLYAELDNDTAEQALSDALPGFYKVFKVS